MLFPFHWRPCNNCHPLLTLSFFFLGACVQLLTVVVENVPMVHPFSMDTMGVEAYK